MVARQTIPEDTREENSEQPVIPLFGERLHPALAQIVELLAKQAVEDGIKENRK